MRVLVIDESLERAELLRDGLGNLLQGNPGQDSRSHLVIWMRVVEENRADFSQGEGCLVKIAKRPHPLFLSQGFGASGDVCDPICVRRFRDSHFTDLQSMVGAWSPHAPG